MANGQNMAEFSTPLSILLDDFGLKTLLASDQQSTSSQFVSCDEPVTTSSDTELASQTLCSTPDHSELGNISCTNDNAEESEGEEPVVQQQEQQS